MHSSRCINREEKLKPEKKTFACSELILSCVSGIWKTLLWRICFWLDPISDKAQATAKIVSHIKSGQKWHKIIISLLTKFRSKSLRHSYQYIHCHCLHVLSNSNYPPKFFYNLTLFYFIDILALTHYYWTLCYYVNKCYFQQNWTCCWPTRFCSFSILWDSNFRASSSFG